MTAAMTLNPIKKNINMFELELRLDSLYEALNNNSAIHLSFVNPFDCRIYKEKPASKRANFL